MSPPWKLLLGLALVLPVGGYVAGSLAASATEDPAPREAIVIREAPSGTADTSPAPSRTPSVRPAPGPGSGDEDDEGDEGPDDSDDRPGGVPVVSPQPDDLEEDRDDDLDDDRGDGDDDDDDDGGDD